MQTKKPLTWFIQLLLILLAIAARLLPGARTIDDAYITFRYARNIVAGNGFVYNPGEHVLGTTTPLYTLLLSLCSLPLGGEQAPFPEMAQVINALADGLTCLILLRLGMRLGYPWAGAGMGLLWAITPYSVTFAIGGLETSVYVFLLCACGWAYLQEKRILSALAGSFMLMTRPDALIFLGPLALDRLWRMARPALEGAKAPVGEAGEPSGRGQSRPWLELLALLLPTAIWALFATLYFGSPLPHSITAKTLAYRLPEMNALQRLSQHYAAPFVDDYTLGVTWMKVGIFLYPILSVLGGRLAYKAQARSWPFFAFPWLYFLTFSLANPLIFRWYLTPPLPPYQLSILIAGEHLLRQLFVWRAKGEAPLSPLLKGLRTTALALLVAAPLLLSINAWTLRPDHGQAHPAPRMAWIALELYYRQAAELLNEDFQASETPPLVAAGDVGVLGYYTSAHILDTVGLNSPQSVRYYPLDASLYATNYAIPPDLIMDYHPDAVVILEVYGRLGLLEDARFNQQYRLRHKLEADIYGSEGMLIFERLD
ncbi:MAG: hypothetical protein PHS96_14105 [Anaerolineales bacterium]|nr:hypothetical protein [Anaerolineales bacterium]